MLVVPLGYAIRVSKSPGEKIVKTTTQPYNILQSEECVWGHETNIVQKRSAIASSRSNHVVNTQYVVPCDDVIV